MRDRAEVGADPRSSRGVLDDFSRYLGDVHLLGVRPRVLQERTEGTKRLADGPLVLLCIESLEPRSTFRLSGPSGCDAQRRLCLNRFHRLPVIRIDHELESIIVEPIDGPSIEHDDPHLVGWLREFEAGVGLLGRDTNPGCVQCRGPCQALCRIHARVAPVHHHDPGDEPHEE